jgi:hypothetical protein
MKGESVTGSGRGKSSVRWRQADGSPVACEEKLKVLEENLAEIRQMSQDAFEDALLMGCDEAQIREVFASVVRSLRNPYIS